MKSRPLLRCETIPGHHEPIAVVGIGCRFPGRANDPETFWRLLEAGVDAVTEIPADRWNCTRSTTPIPPGRARLTAAGAASSTGSTVSTRTSSASRREKRPAWTRSSGSCSKWPGRGWRTPGCARIGSPASRTAVFVGISSFDYSVLETSFRDRGEIDVYSNTGGSLSIAANRISYCFDFRGPSAAVDTACSSALVAVHLACRSIWQDGCPMALAGGVNALLLPDWYVGFCRMGMLSPEGRCRAFDAGASGFVRSEGAGMVVLKPLAQALADGDRVYAVIRGTAMNQDGRTPGMTVPSQEAQEALSAPGLPRRAVSRRRRSSMSRPTAPAPRWAIRSRPVPWDGSCPTAGRRSRPCLIGSVKTNIGHLEAGAGIAGLIKVAAGAAPSPHPRQPALRSAQPGNRLRRAAPPRADALRALARRRRPGPGGRQRLRLRRHQRPRRSCKRHHRARSSLTRRSATVGDARNGSESPSRAWLVPLSARGPEALRAAARSLEEFLGTAPGDVSLEEICRRNAALRRTPSRSPPGGGRPLEAGAGGAPEGIRRGRAGAGRGGGASVGRPPAAARVRLLGAGAAVVGDGPRNCCARSRSSAPRSSVATRSCDGSATGHCSTS